MARAHFADVLIGTSGTGALSLLDGATVHVYDQGTMTPISQTIYAADSGGTTIANPLTSDANGKVEFWLDTPARVDLAASKGGFSPSTRTVDVEAAPSGGGSGWTLLDSGSLSVDVDNFSVTVPQTKTHLQLRAYLLNTDTFGGVGDFPLLAINGDAEPTHYASVALRQTSGSPVVTQASADPLGGGVAFFGAAGGLGDHTSVVVEFPFYRHAGMRSRQWRAEGSYFNPSGPALTAYRWDGIWLSGVPAAAITSLVLDNTESNQFGAGSFWELWGI